MTVNESVVVDSPAILNVRITTSKLLVDWVGVPEISPVEGLKDKPVGRDPDLIARDVVLAMVDEGRALKDAPFTIVYDACA